MSSRDGLQNLRLPRSHYFLSIARGDSLRTFALRPLALWASLALAPLAMLWGGGATLFIAFHDDLIRVILERQAQMQNAYEDRLAEAQDELDRLAGRRRLEQAAIESKMRDVVSRQAQLEQRGSLVAALAGEAAAHASAAAEGPYGALTAIKALGGPAPADSVLSPAARGFAPEPRPASTQAAPPAGASRETTSAIHERKTGREVADHASGANNPAIDAATRLGLIDHSLDGVERDQDAALGQIASAARGTATRLAAVFAKTGLSPKALSPPEVKGGVGGPFIPASLEAPDGAVAEASREVENADRLRRLMPYVPVRAPLAGEASLTSPFGYRLDPFLGRPALHPGVDLVQAYGSEIHATASGRVIHAGWIGGYGNMVEIDHGNGLATRYGHMSEVVVAEGDEIAAGALLGRIGTTGRSTGPHLHYEVRIDGEPVDPQRFLQAGAEMPAQ
jgi:murein DD-endopeptidase MepM/ murein hydrolase activator NlpD